MKKVHLDSREYWTEMQLEAELQLSASVIGGASLRGTMAGWELSLNSSGSSCTHKHTDTHIENSPGILSTVA